MHKKNWSKLENYTDSSSVDQYTSQDYPQGDSHLRVPSVDSPCKRQAVSKSIPAKLVTSKSPFQITSKSPSFGSHQETTSPRHLPLESSSSSDPEDSVCPKPTLPSVEMSLRSHQRPALCSILDRPRPNHPPERKIMTTTTTIITAPRRRRWGTRPEGESPPSERPRVFYWPDKVVLGKGCHGRHRVPNGPIRTRRRTAETKGTHIESVWQRPARLFVGSTQTCAPLCSGTRYIEGCRVTEGCCTVTTTRLANSRRCSCCCRCHCRDRSVV